MVSSGGDARCRAKKLLCRRDLGQGRVTHKGGKAVLLRYFIAHTVVNALIMLGGGGERKKA